MLSRRKDTKTWLRYVRQSLYPAPGTCSPSVHEGGDGEGDGGSVTRRQEPVERGLQKRGGYTAQFLESYLQHRTKVLGREQEGDGQGLQREDREGVGRNLHRGFGEFWRAALVLLAGPGMGLKS